MSPGKALDALRLEHGVKCSPGAAVGVADEDLPIAFEAGVNPLGDCRRDQLWSVVESGGRHSTSTQSSELTRTTSRISFW